MRNVIRRFQLARPPKRRTRRPGQLSGAHRKSTINQQGPHSTQSDYFSPVRLARARQLRTAMPLDCGHERTTRSRAACGTTPPPLVVTGRRGSRCPDCARYAPFGCRSLCPSRLSPRRVPVAATGAPVMSGTESFAGLKLGYYRTILVDPPWPYRTWSAKGSAVAPSRIMTR
jgi:hypothetical protein